MAKRVMSFDEGTDRMKKISASIRAGANAYLKRQYTDRLRKAMCSEDDQMNVHFYTGKDISVGQIIDQAETMPFLAQRRVIFISDSNLFKSGGEQLAEYLKSPAETAYFVFTESEVDKRSKLYNTVQSKGYAAEFTQLDEDTLLRWIGKTLAKENKKISQNTAQLFLEKAGTDMENIQMELEKLISYCLDREVITQEDIEAVCTTRLQDRIFEMVEATARHDHRTSLNLYYDLLALKVEPLKILSLLSRQYNLMLQAKELKKKGFADKDIASRIGVPPFAVRKYVAQASSYHTSELRRALEQCAEMDQAVKTGRLDGRMSVELLILGGA